MAREPLGEEARAVLTPRACAIGGTTVALIGVSTTNERPPVASCLFYAK